MGLSWTELGLSYLGTSVERERPIEPVADESSREAVREDIAYTDDSLRFAEGSGGHGPEVSDPYNPGDGQVFSSNPLGNGEGGNNGEGI